MKNYMLIQVMLIAFFPGIFNNVTAQKVVLHDSNYFKTFPHTLTVRLYGIHKYGEFNIPPSNNTPHIRYAPNTKFSLGAGFTYKNFTLNGALGFGFVNKDDEKGKTKSFNIQAHAYPDKWTVDLLASFHKGEYILPKGFDGADANSYYVRPDVKSNLAGLAAYRMSNYTKFSYRAAMVQNEWQQKSAGTFLFGAQAYYASIKGDSSLVPSVSANSFKQAGIDKISVITVGPGIGYAYTLVAAKHVYIMASLIGNVDVNFANEYTAGVSNNKTSVEPAAIYKAAIGYNSASWGVVGVWAGNALLFKGSAYSKAYFLPTGLFSVAVNKKIFLRK